MMFTAILESSILTNTGSYQMFDEFSEYDSPFNLNSNSTCLFGSGNDLVEISLSKDAISLGDHRTGTGTPWFDPPTSPSTFISEFHFPEPDKLLSLKASLKGGEMFDEENTGCMFHSEAAEHEVTRAKNVTPEPLMSYHLNSSKYCYRYLDDSYAENSILETPLPHPPLISSSSLRRPFDWPGCQESPIFTSTRGYRLLDEFAQDTTGTPVSLNLTNDSSFLLGNNFGENFLPEDAILQAGHQMPWSNLPSSSPSGSAFISDFQSSEPGQHLEEKETKNDDTSMFIGTEKYRYDVTQGKNVVLKPPMSASYHHLDSANHNDIFFSENSILPVPVSVLASVSVPLPPPSLITYSHLRCPYDWPGCPRALVNNSNSLKGLEGSFYAQTIGTSTGIGNGTSLTQKCHLDTFWPGPVPELTQSKIAGVDLLPTLPFYAPGVRPVTSSNKGRKRNVSTVTGMPKKQTKANSLSLTSGFDVTAKRIDVPVPLMQPMLGLFM